MQCLVPLAAVIFLLFLLLAMMVSLLMCSIYIPSLAGPKQFFYFSIEVTLEVYSNVFEHVSKFPDTRPLQSMLMLRVTRIRDQRGELPTALQYSVHASF